MKPRNSCLLQVGRVNAKLYKSNLVETITAYARPVGLYFKINCTNKELLSKVKKRQNCYIEAKFVNLLV